MRNPGESRKELGRIRALTHPKRTGHQRETWRRTVERERAEMRLTSRAAAGAVAFKNRDNWGTFLALSSNSARDQGTKLSY